MRKVHFSYMNIREAERYSYFMLPKNLVTEDYFKNVSADAKILYAILLDLTRLSRENSWVDENGYVYVRLSIEKIRRTMNCGNEKAVKLLRELDDTGNGIGLIHKKRQGQGKSTIIYVKDFYVENTDENDPVRKLAGDHEDPDKVPNMSSFGNTNTVPYSPYFQSGAPTSSSDRYQSMPAGYSQQFSGHQSMPAGHPVNSPGCSPHSQSDNRQGNIGIGFGSLPGNVPYNISKESTICHGQGLPAMAANHAPINTDASPMTSGSSALSPAPMNKDLSCLLPEPEFRKVPSEEPESADNIVDFPRPYAVSELASTECDSVSKQDFSCQNQNSENQNSENRNSRIPKSRIQEFRKSECIKNNSIKTNIINPIYPSAETTPCSVPSPAPATNQKMDGMDKGSHKSTSNKNQKALNPKQTLSQPVDDRNPDMTSPIDQQIDQLEDYYLTHAMVRENISYERLIQDYPGRKDNIDEIVNLITEAIAFPSRSLHIGDLTVPPALIHAQYMKLDYSCIRYVLESMDHTTSRIRNMHAYLRTALYNAVNTVSNFISAEVNADLYGEES